jgi:hypothetical protein
MLADNTGGTKIMLWSVRFQCGGVQNSNGLPHVIIYTWLRVHTILTRAKYDSHQTFWSNYYLSQEAYLYIYTHTSTYST